MTAPAHGHDTALNTGPGGPSAKTFHRAGSPNLQIASKEPLNV